MCTGHLLYVYNNSNNDMNIYIYIYIFIVKARKKLIIMLICNSVFLPSVGQQLTGQKRNL